MRRVLQSVAAVCALAALVLTPVPAAAQEAASIVGIVQDSSGAVMPGVTVEAVEPRPHRKGAQRGHRRLRAASPSSACGPATYSVTFTLAGLQDRPARRHRAGRRVRRDGQREPRGRRARGDRHGDRRVAGRRPPEHAEPVRGQPRGARRAAGDALDAGRRQPRARRELLQPGIRQHDVGARVGLGRPARSTWTACASART